MDTHATSHFYSLATSHRLRPRIACDLAFLLACDLAFLLRMRPRKYIELVNSTNELVKIWSFRKPKILYETSFRVKLRFMENFDIFIFIH